MLVEGVPLSWDEVLTVGSAALGLGPCRLVTFGTGLATTEDQSFPFSLRRDILKFGQAGSLTGATLDLLTVRTEF